MASPEACGGGSQLSEDEERALGRRVTGSELRHLGEVTVSREKRARSNAYLCGCNYHPILRMGKSILQSKGTEPRRYIPGPADCKAGVLCAMPRCLLKD